MTSTSNFGQIGLPTTVLDVFERLKRTERLKMGDNVASIFFFKFGPDHLFQFDSEWHSLEDCNIRCVQTLY